MRATPALLLALLCGTVWAGQATVAVAANFLAPAEQLAARFEADSGHRLRLASGSTGSLYTLVSQGAPFDLLLAADQARPLRLGAAGLAVAETRCTYALGRLLLWSAEAARIGEDPQAALRDPALRHLAIANPATAPYGAAAQQVLRQLGLWDALQERLVRGMDVGQTYHMVVTGNAELGFIAASSLAAAPSPGGSRWRVPASLHAPLAQDAVLLRRGAGNAAAEGFLRFLGSDAAWPTIARYGYARPASAACGA